MGSVVVEDAAKLVPGGTYQVFPSDPLVDLFARGDINLNSGTYTLGSNVEPAEADVKATIKPTAAFAGAGKLDYKNLIPYQGTPVLSHDLLRKTIGSDYADYANIFVRGAVVHSDIATVPVVALFGEASGDAVNSKVWGSNFVSYANASGAIAISQELNFGVFAAGGAAYGLVLATAGDQPGSVAFIQAQNNTTISAPLYGIRFLGTSSICVSDDVILASNFSVVDGIDFSTLTCTGAEWKSTNLVVPASNQSNNSHVRITGGTAQAATISSYYSGGGASALPIALQFACRLGADMSFRTKEGGSNVLLLRNSTDAGDYLQITAGSGGVFVGTVGSSNNSDLILRGKGSGGAYLRDGGDVTKIQVNSTGIGFYAATPIAKPTVTGSRGSNAALASLLTALASLGLLTDSSS